MAKWIVVSFAWVCVAWGLLALVVPLIPTTPFLLLGLYLLSKHDPRAARWLKVRLGRARARWTRLRLKSSPV